MEIRTNTWHYKVWKFTWSINEEDMPERTSLCRYIWRILLLPVPMGTLFLFLVGFATVAFLVGNILCILPGRGYMAFLDHGCTAFPHLKFGKHSVPVVVILWPAYAVAGLTYFAVNFPYQTLKWGGIAVVCVAGLAIVVLALVIVSGRWKNSETRRLIGAYLKARKEKVCPLVVFKG